MTTLTPQPPTDPTPPAGGARLAAPCSECCTTGGYSHAGSGVPLRSRGLCSICYQRAVRHGTLPSTWSTPRDSSEHVCACGATGDAAEVWLQGRCPACHAAIGIVAPFLRCGPTAPVLHTSTEMNRFASACTGAYAPWHRPLAEWQDEWFGDDAEDAA